MIAISRFAFSGESEACAALIMMVCQFSPDRPAGALADRLAGRRGSYEPPQRPDKQSRSIFPFRERRVLQAGIRLLSSRPMNSTMLSQVRAALSGQVFSRETAAQGRRIPPLAQRSSMNFESNDGEPERENTFNDPPAADFET